MKKSSKNIVFDEYEKTAFRVTLQVAKEFVFYVEGRMLEDAHGSKPDTIRVGGHRFFQGILLRIRRPADSCNFLYYLFGLPFLLC